MLLASYLLIYCLLMLTAFKFARAPLDGKTILMLLAGQVVGGGLAAAALPNFSPSTAGEVFFNVGFTAFGSFIGTMISVGIRRPVLAVTASLMLVIWMLGGIVLSQLSLLSTMILYNSPQQ